MTFLEPQQIDELINDEVTVRALLASHLGKTNKVDFFYNGMKKIYKDEKWTDENYWSWWAFWGNIFYLFYRKMYLLAFLGALILVGMSALFEGLDSKGVA